MSSEKTIVTRVQLRYVIETSMPENSKMVIMTRGDAVAETSSIIIPVAELLHHATESVISRYWRHVSETVSETR